MKRHIRLLTTLAVVASMGIARAATFTVTTTASSGAGSFTQAILDADASADAANTIRFNIPGAGPHYIAPPANGFPLLIKDNTTIDGYSQPGSSVNTKPITQTNDAKIKIVLDARAPNANFRDMAYVFYGTYTTSDPVINNTSMAGADPYTLKTFERGGFTPKTGGGLVSNPYTREEVAILGIYRATNVTIKGLAFLGDGANSAAAGLSEYAVAVALDYGLDTAVNDRFNYPQGSSKNFHISGCWIGFDPATGAEFPSGAAIAAFRHRDKEVGGTRPELPNMENMTIGVKAGSSNPRAEFNVLGALGLTVAGEGIRCTLAGNQFLGPADMEIGRYDDTQVPSVVIGTDGNGVNDAEEGNLFPATTPLFYGTGNKVFVFAGNTFGLARDGSRPNLGIFAEDEFNFSARTKVQFGSDFDGINDALEANTLYDTIGFSVNPNAPDDNAWISMRGNSLINNAIMPVDETFGLNLYNKFIDVAGANPITPVITAATTTSLTGTCGLPLPNVARVEVDIYVADPEGDTAGAPQGKKYLGTFTDNSAADSNPAVGAFTFNTSSLGITAGTKVTINANYIKSSAPPTISSIARSGNNTTLTFIGGAAPYSVARSATVNGTYTDFTTAAASPAVFADPAASAFYRVGSAAAGNGGQTSPFAISATVP